MINEEARIPTQSITEHFGPTGNFLLVLSKVAAVFGGLIFLGLVVISIVSIVGRKLFSSPVAGDVEILQMSSAFAAAFFFAYCHLQGEDLRVDFFSNGFSYRSKRVLDAMASFSVGLFGALLAWRSTVGALSTKEFRETSMILEWPLWVPQLLMVLGFVLLSISGFYMATLYWSLRLKQGEEKG